MPDLAWGKTAKLHVKDRISGLLWVQKQVVKPHDLSRWERLLQNDQLNLHARLGAAYFLADQDPLARKLIEEQLQSDNVRHRYNAAAILTDYVGTDATKTWAIALLIRHLADGSLDQVSLEPSDGERLSSADDWDLTASPITIICRRLGIMKVKEAVPALLACLDRKTAPHQAVRAALAEIGETKSSL